MFRIFLKSILNRKFSFFLTFFSIGLSVALFLSVERVRQGAQSSFTNSLSKTDLVVGARGSGIQLLLYTVFHMGNATNNISWSSYQDFKKDPQIAWTIPISLGDSYHGFRVVATDENFYQHYTYLENHHPEIQDGKFSNDIFDVTLGNDVALKEKLKIGDEIALTHGVSTGPGILNHRDKPFKVVGILKKSGTALDRGVYITLEGMEAIHIDWKNGAPPLVGHGIPATKIHKEQIQVGEITSFLVGAKSRLDALYLQRKVNDYRAEPLMAIIPGVALSELWQTVHSVEIALQVVTLMVVFVGLIGMMVAIFNTLESRRREIAILRAIGVSIYKICLILIAESFLLGTLGSVFGIILCYVTLLICKPFILNQFGIQIILTSMQGQEFIFLLCFVVLSLFLGLIPTYQAYKNSLSDGLTIRV